MSQPITILIGPDSVDPDRPKFQGSQAMFKLAEKDGPRKTVFSMIPNKEYYKNKKLNNELEGQFSHVPGGKVRCNEAARKSVDMRVINDPIHLSLPICCCGLFRRSSLVSSNASFFSLSLAIPRRSTKGRGSTTKRTASARRPTRQAPSTPGSGQRVTGTARAPTTRRRPRASRRRTPATGSAGSGAG